MLGFLLAIHKQIFFLFWEKDPYRGGNLLKKSSKIIINKLLLNFFKLLSHILFLCVSEKGSTKANKGQWD